MEFPTFFVAVTDPDGGTAALTEGLMVVRLTLIATGDAMNIVEDGSIDLAMATLPANDTSARIAFRAA